MKISLRKLSSFFSATRQAFYKRRKNRKDIQPLLDMVLELVRERKKLLPNEGARKLLFRLKPDLKRLSIELGRDRLFSLLRENGLLVRRKKRYAVTTNSRHHFRKYGNLIKEKEVTAPNEVFVSDITYLRTSEKFVYLSLVTDLFSRKIVGYNVSESLSIEGSILSLKMSLNGLKKDTGLIHHSDRGVQYCSYAYTDILKEHGMQISMTEENHCYENAVAERVNGILKQEFALDRVFSGLKEAVQAVEEALHLYNNERLHWSLGLKTPSSVYMEAA